MKMYIGKVLASLILMISPTLLSAEYKASLAKMPVYATSSEEGVLVDLVKEISKVSGEKINITVLPFKSSIYMVEKNKADFHMPLIKNDNINEDNLPFYYSTETIFNVNFVIYSSKNKSIDVNNLSNYNIETDRAHIEFFPFKTEPTNSISKSLEKVNNNEIDAFIFADFATDPFLKESNLKNIKRDLYKIYDVKMVLQKNENGKKIDLILTDAIKKLKNSGKYQEIINKINLPYNNWQL